MKTFLIVLGLLAGAGVVCYWLWRRSLPAGYDQLTPAAQRYYLQGRAQPRVDFS